MGASSGAGKPGDNFGKGKQKKEKKGGTHQSN